MNKIKLSIIMVVVALGVCFYLVSKIMDNNMKAIELLQEAQVEKPLFEGEHGVLEPRPEEVPKRDTVKLTPEIEMGDGVSEYREMTDEEWCRDWLKKAEAWESKAAFEEAIKFYDNELKKAEEQTHVFEEAYKKCNGMLKAAEEANMPEDSQYMRHLRDECKDAFRYHPDQLENYEKWKKEKADFLKSFRKGLEAQS